MIINTVPYIHITLVLLENYIVYYTYITLVLYTYVILHLHYNVLERVVAKKVLS